MSFDLTGVISSCEHPSGGASQCLLCFAPKHPSNPCPWVYMQQMAGPPQTGASSLVLSSFYNRVVTITVHATGTDKDNATSATQQKICYGPDTARCYTEKTQPWCS